MNTQHFDTLIIGAGLSGIGTAVHLNQGHPERSLAILERRERLGGTWDLFRYPGIRSDSDMASFGYRFKPWNSSKVLADGPSICRYIGETAQEHGLLDKIQYGLKVVESNWSSAQQRWRLTAERTGSGERQHFTCRFLINCSGYYNYDAGYRPSFAGEDDFKGQIVHPQQWPENLDYAGKKVLVIGSGATAVTVVPTMAKTAAHVTMLQRSPSYVFSLPDTDRMAITLRKFLPQNLAYRIVRGRNIAFQRGLYLACRRWPKQMRRFLLNQVRKQVGPDVDMRHFSPNYMPWDERLCAVPDGDLFVALREKRASMVTDQIDRFTADGVRLKSGNEIKADIIVTATGLNIQMLGGMDLKVDDVPTPLNRQMTYKGALVQNIPNFMWVFGYTNAPWTLKSDIAGRYLNRLFDYMDARGLGVVTPRDTQDNATDGGILDSLQSGYVQRGKAHLPRQGRSGPWQVLMHYGKDKKVLLDAPIDDGCLEFRAAQAAPVTSAPLHTQAAAA
jgi:monooxygenase